MIKKILIIKSNGVLCYSKSFMDEKRIDEDFVSGFFTAVSDIAKEIGGGEIKSLSFRNFNIFYSFNYEKSYIFIIITDVDDLEDEIRYKVELLKMEFMKRYRHDLENWDYDIRKFKSFDEFTEKQIFIPPKILLVGEVGVGKTTIMNLFPGDTVIKLDEYMNDIIQKTIYLPKLKEIGEIIVREIDLRDLIDNLNTHQQFLDSVEIFCIVTNSGAKNLKETKRLFTLLKPKVKKADFYIIANFQDLKDMSFLPEKIEEYFKIKTFGISAISKKANKKIYNIITEMVEYSIIKKYSSSKKEQDGSKIENDDDITIILN
ncbi:MAG: hypothetical protein ACFFB0_01820 [Promethearchaeota archaeon]